jgi:SAM-dependent methyltransferase
MAWSDDGPRPDQDLVVDYILMNVSPGSRIIEIGCGSGRLLGQLRGQFQLAGVEPRVESAHRASVAAQCRVFGSLEALPDDEKFDVAILVDVIEHVPDPLGLLRKIRDKLSERGRIVISTGNGDHWFARLCRNRWWYVSYPEHVTVLSRTWFELRSADAGLKVVHMRRFNRFRLSMAHRIVAFVSAFASIAAPALMSRLSRSFRRSSCEREGASAFGAGAAADHLLAVLEDARRA